MDELELEARRPENINELEDLLLSGASWQHVYPVVETEIREFLAGLEDGRTLTTNYLIDIFLGHQEHTPARKRLNQALNALAKHGLVDCMTLGPSEQRSMYGKMVAVRPKLWHAPDGIDRAVICKTCGQEIPTKT